MKHIWSVLQRSIKKIIFMGMFSTVHFKLIQNDSNWITKTLLCWVSYLIALIFRAIEVENQKKINHKNKIVDINTRKYSTLFKILDIIATSFIMFVIYAFIIGVILGLENWTELVGNMLLYFIIPYIFL